MSKSITSHLAYCGFSVQTLITPGSEWTSQEIKQDSLELNLEENPRIITHHCNIEFWNRLFKTLNYFLPSSLCPPGKKFYSYWSTMYWRYSLTGLWKISLKQHHALFWHTHCTIHFFVCGFKCTMQQSTIFPLADKGLETSNKVLKCCSVITNMRKL